MSRAARLYRERAEPSLAYAGHDPDQPVAGFYRMRLRSGGAPVAVSIWHGLPIDPASSDEMDRALRWNATVNGRWAELSDVWPRCAGDPIDQAEAMHLIKLQRWGADNGVAALADPSKRIDPLHSPLMF